MNEREQQPDDFPAAFEEASARLLACVESACAVAGPWAEGVAAAVRQALELAAVDPAGANLLTNGALAKGPYGVAHYEGLLDHLGRLLASGRALVEHGEALPELLERALVGGVVTIVADRIEHGRAEELPAVAGEVIQFVLTPYVGPEEARRVAER